MEIFLAITISTGVWFFIIREKDSIDKEPFLTLLKVLVLGGFISIFVTTLINIILPFLLPQEYSYFLENIGLLSKADFKTLIIIGMIIGIVEENAKAWAGIILTNKLKDFDEPVDGIIYGMIVGLGFAAIENVMYILEHSIYIIFIRSVMSIPMHIICGAIWGYGLALNKFRFKRHSNLFNIAPFILLAAILHGLYDALVFSGSVYFLVAAVLLIMGSYRLIITQTRKLALDTKNLKKNGM